MPPARTNAPADGSRRFVARATTQNTRPTESIFQTHCEFPVEDPGFHASSGWIQIPPQGFLGGVKSHSSADADSALPRLRLRVTAAAESRIRSGHPWLFADSIREQNRAGK